MSRILRVQTQAAATAVSAVCNFLVMREVIDWSAADIAAFNLAYASVMIVARQFLSDAKSTDG